MPFFARLASLAAAVRGAPPASGPAVARRPRPAMRAATGRAPAAKLRDDMLRQAPRQWPLVAGLTVAGLTSMGLPTSGHALQPPPDRPPVGASAIRPSTPYPQRAARPTLPRPAGSRPAPSGRRTGTILFAATAEPLWSPIHIANALEAIVSLDVEQPLPPTRWQPTLPSRGSGTGMLLDLAPGHIVTNAHVVEDAVRIRVTFKDGRETEAVVRGVDRATDMAVLEMRPALSPRQTLTLSSPATEATLLPGTPVLALGNPLGLTFSVTRGILSARDRSRELRALRSQDGLVIQDFFQVDAAVSPGSSGGPLLSPDHTVAGMITAVSGAPAGASYGFAIPASLMREVVPALLATGHVPRPRLGVQVFDLTAADRRMLSTPASVLTGVWIATTPAPGTPAADAGLARGDVLMRWEADPIRDASMLGRLLQRSQPGQAVRLGIFRQGQELERLVRLGEPADPESDATDLPRLREQAQNDFPPIWRLGLEVGQSEQTPMEGLVVVDVAPRQDLRERLTAGDWLLAVRTRGTEWRPLRTRLALEQAILQAMRDGEALGLQIRPRFGGAVREINLAVLGVPPTDRAP